MKMGNTFWPNLAMKTWFFTHVLDKSPQNAYMPCEFWLAVKKQIVEYYVGFIVIFWLIILYWYPLCSLMSMLLYLLYHIMFFFLKIFCSKFIWPCIKAISIIYMFLSNDIQFISSDFWACHVYYMLYSEVPLCRLAIYVMG